MTHIQPAPTQERIDADKRRRDHLQAIGEGTAARALNLTIEAAQRDLAAAKGGGVKTQVFSCGGGTQSAAIAALIVRGDLPKPDAAVLVNTGRERGSTWEYANTVLVPELEKVGVTLHMPLSRDYATVDLYSTNDEHLLIPAFTTQSGSVGKLTNFCSGEWKKRVRTRFLRRELGITDECAWIGFSVDESRRALRMMAGQEYQEGRIRLPLIHDVPMRRPGCIDVVRSMGWPDPPRSACWMCPNQGDDEWLDLRTNRPDEWEQACELDELLRLRDPHVFLHSSGTPLRQADLERRDGGLFSERACESGMCFV